MTNTNRIAQLQADKLKLQELIKSGNVDTQQCKGMIKMLDYKIRKLKNKQPPARWLNFCPRRRDE